MEKRVAAPAPLPHVIHPQAVYTHPALRAALGLCASTARREIRAGRLRVAKRGGRYYFLGKWILEWLRGGEIHRPRAEQQEIAQQ
jgi:hypothetical protein